MPKTKRNPRSEVAQREAFKNRKNVSLCIVHTEKTIEVHASSGTITYAIFDIRDCFRKRQPLTGITKKIRKAIQPKKGKK